MAVLPTTSAQNTGFIPELWLGTALGRLKQLVGVINTIQRDTDYGAKPQEKGDTLHLPRRGTLTVNNRAAETDDYSFQTPTSDTIDLTLNKNPDVTFGMSSLALAFSNQDTIAGYIEDAVVALAENVASDIIAALYAGTTNAFINSGGALSEAIVLAARKKLVDNKVSRMSPKYSLVSTTQTNVLLGLDKFTRYDSLGVAANSANGTIGAAPIATLDGGFGRFAGFDFMESQLIDVDGSPLTEPQFFYAPTGMMIAFRELPLPDPGTGAVGTVMTDPDTGLAMRLIKSWNPQKGCEQITLDMLYGLKSPRPDHIVVTKTAA